MSFADEWKKIAFGDHPSSADLAEGTSGSDSPHRQDPMIASDRETSGHDLNDHVELKAADLPDGEPGDCPELTPAHSLVECCRQYGVALRIDDDGNLVVGRAGASADEASQPWPSLLAALEAHIDAVAELVAAGWSLQASIEGDEQ